MSRLGAGSRRVTGLLALLVAAVASEASAQSVFHAQSQTTDVLTSAAVSARSRSWSSRPTR